MSSSTDGATFKSYLLLFQEEKGGRHFRKIGFTDINLAEYAGGGPSTQRYILQPYDQNHRLDNSILQITLNITLKEGDTIFQRYFLALARGSNPPALRSTFFLS